MCEKNELSEEENKTKNSLRCVTSANGTLRGLLRKPQISSDYNYHDVAYVRQSGASVHTATLTAAIIEAEQKVQRARIFAAVTQLTYARRQ